MNKIKFITFSILTLALILFTLLNFDTTKKILVNDHPIEYKIPIYLKIFNFFNRHYNYKYFVKKINANKYSKEEIIINTSKWVHQNIKKIPEGVDSVDSDPLSIITRRLGAQYQFSDILSVLLTYSDIETYFFNNHPHQLTFFKINNYWSVLDPYYGIFFINEKETFASIDDLKKNEWRIVNFSSQKINLMDISKIFYNDFKNYDEVKDHYRKIFINIKTGKQIDDIKTFNRGRAYLQKPFNRIKFEIYKIFK